MFWFNVVSDEKKNYRFLCIYISRLELTSQLSCAHLKSKCHHFENMTKKKLAIIEIITKTNNNGADTESVLLIRNTNAKRYKNIHIYIYTHTHNHAYIHSFDRSYSRILKGDESKTSKRTPTESKSTHTNHLKSSACDVFSSSVNFVCGFYKSVFIYIYINSYKQKIASTAGVRFSIAFHCRL